MSLVLSRGSLYLEVRILPAQPPSLGFPSSLSTFLNECVRSAEIRHRIAVSLQELTPVRRSRCAGGRFLPLYSTGHFAGSHSPIAQMLCDAVFGVAFSGAVQCHRAEYERSADDSFKS
jgi:hypothetical protein